MPATKTLSLLTVLAVGASVHASGGQGLTAKEVLLRSMQRVLPVNVVAIIVQRDPFGDGAFQTVRVERDRSGKIHHTVLQPLRLQGMESADDGDRSMIYWPDQNLLIDQDSPQRNPDDAESRMALASRNYSFKFGDSTTVAGRSAYCVVATPRSSALDVRRYYIDQETFFSLRMETVAPGRPPSLYVDTKDVKYPKKIDADSFVLKPIGSPRVQRYSPYEELSMESANRRMGFYPLLPDAMPMGFKLQEMQLTNTNRWKAVAIRITDGLVRATIYQWRGGPRDLTSLEDRTAAEHNGINMILVSDLRSALREQLLNAFIQRADIGIPVSNGFASLAPAPRAVLPAVLRRGLPGLAWERPTPIGALNSIENPRIQTP